MTMVEDTISSVRELKAAVPSTSWVEPAAPVTGMAAGRQTSALSTTPPAVEIKELNLFYGKNQALQSVSLQIPEKQVTAFIGPSGCGKSTLLRCINRMNDLVDTCRIEGSIKIHGR